MPPLLAKTPILQSKMQLLHHNDRMAAFLQARQDLETKCADTLDKQIQMHIGTPEYTTALEQEVNHTYNDHLYTICMNLKTQASECQEDAQQIQACSHFDTYSHHILLHGTRGIPTKVLAKGARLMKYIEGQCLRFSKETTRKKLHRQSVAHRRKELQKKMENEKNARLAALITQFADDLSMSDHEPIRCTCSFDSLKKHSNNTLVVSGWNCQEFVQDGVSTYIAHMPCIMGTKGKGKSKWISHAMLSQHIRTHHCQRVVRVVCRELCAKHAIAICLQELDHDVLMVLKQHFKHVHACGYSIQEIQEHQKAGKCSALTCIIVSPQLSKTDYQYVGPLADIVVQTNNKTRKYARIEFLNHVNNTKIEIVSVHVRHDSLSKVVRGGGGGGGSSSTTNARVHGETKQNTTANGIERDQQSFATATINTVNILQAETQLRAGALQTSSTLIAVGDWNGPQRTPPLQQSTATVGATPSNKTNDDHHNGWNVQARLIPTTPTQYLNPFPVDGIVVMRNDNQLHHRLTLHCEIQPQ